jgi:hypothetical protein
MTNDDIRVFASVDNGATWTQVGHGRFSAQNHFAFSGTFALQTVQKVRVRVQEFANWGDGAKPGAPGFAEASPPAACTPTTTTTQTTTTPTTTTTATTTATTTTSSTTTTAETTPTTTTTATTTSTPVETAPKPAPAITIVKTERGSSTGTYRQGPIVVTTGATIDYRMVVTNTGNEQVTVTLADPRCDANTLTAAGTTTLAAGASVSFTCTHRFRSQDPSPFANTATASATALSGAPVLPVSSTVVATRRIAVVLGASHVQVAVAKVKKVTVKAKPAKPVQRAAQFTG